MKKKTNPTAANRRGLGVCGIRGFGGENTVEGKIPTHKAIGKSVRPRKITAEGNKAKWERDYEDEKQSGEGKKERSRATRRFIIFPLIEKHRLTNKIPRY